MKNLKKLLLITSLTLLLCCSKENMKEVAQSAHEIVKTNIVKDYLTDVRSELLSAAKNRLDSVQSNLLWDKAAYVFQSSEKSIIQIPINEGKVLALFYTNGAKNKIDSSVICLLVNEANSAQKNTGLEFGKRDIVVSKLVRPPFSVKNGDIKTYSIDNIFKKQYHFENDKLLSIKEISTKDKKTGNGIKSNQQCWDHWLVETFWDGSQIYTYLYTTCDCDEQAYSIDFRNVKEVTIRNNCNGGGGSSYNNPPQEPTCAFTNEEAEEVLGSVNFYAVVGGATMSYSNGVQTYDPIEDKIREPRIIKKEVFRLDFTAYNGHVNTWDAVLTGIRYKDSYSSSTYIPWKWQEISFSGLSIKNADVPTCTDVNVQAFCTPFVINTVSAQAQVFAEAAVKITCVNNQFRVKYKSTTTNLSIDASE